MAKNSKVIKKQMKQYQHLLERYEEMNDYLLELIGEHERTKKERRYMSYFKEHAHEDTDTELPFPYLVL